MLVAILTVGTRGDVQPYVALGRGLRGAGCDVRVVTHARFEDLVVGNGLGFAPLSGDPQALLASRRGQAWQASGRRTVASLRRFTRLTKPWLAQHLLEAEAALSDADLVLFSALGVAGWHVAEANGVPAVPALLQPLHATRSFATVAAPGALRHLGPTGRLATHVIAQQMAWQPFRRQVNAWRRQRLGLAPLPVRRPYRRLLDGGPTLYGFSATVVPRPADWPPTAHITGYWFLDRRADWDPPSALRQFLEAGPPPVVVGFGSRVVADPTAVTRIVADATRTVGCRVILLGGWAAADAGQVSDEVFVSDDVPHDWLLPQATAIVHHGGAGTTAAAFRAGIPSVVLPSFGDQYFWAERVASLGAGPAPVEWRGMTASALAAAVQRATTDTSMAATAATISQRIAAEDGVGQALAVLAPLLSS